MIGPVLSAVGAVLLSLGACAASPSAPAAPASADTVTIDTTRYPSAAATDGRRFDAVRDLDAPGEAPLGRPEADVRARYGPPDAERELDVQGLSNIHEREIEVLNVVRDWAARGEAVRARELIWELPNAWRRTVWLVDGGGTWTSAGGMEWATDRVDF